MTKLKNVFAALSLGLVLCLTATAQTYLSQTTLSSSVGPKTTTIPLASVTGIVAGQTMIYVADGSGETMFVNTVGTNYVGVTRGYQNLGGGQGHNSAALVLYGPANAFLYTQPTGACNRTGQIYLPAVALGNTTTATTISDCLGSVWVTGAVPVLQNPFFRVYQPQPGAVAYTSINTNGTTLTAGESYCAEIDVEFSKNVTGLGVLLGTTGGTDKHLVFLTDATGNLVANSALAGQTAGTASTYEQIPFTAPYYLIGPAKYYACVQTNGTTATVRMLVTSVQDGTTTKGITGTFGTLPTPITAPTTFTTAVGPYFQLY
jgi:hypothetical protein